MINKVTKRDMALLHCLRSNARLTLTQISKKTKIPISTLFDRLRMQQEQETILKHTTLVNFDALGFGTRVQMTLLVDPLQRNNLEHHLAVHNNVNNVFEIAQGSDFLIEGIFKELKEVKQFITLLQERFPSLQYTSHFITKDLKREGFLAN